MPGYKVPACDLPAIDHKYFCPSCGLVLRDAVQLTCGHNYCETCLSNIERHNNSTCLTCEQSVIDMQRFVNNFIRREISDLNVTCKYKDYGCGWQDKLQGMDVHHTTCPCRSMTCRNQNCNEDIPAWGLTDHEQQECLHRPVVCEHCNAPETVGGLQNHLTACPNVPVQCTNCGRENIPRNQIKRHTDPLHGDCTRNMCPFREYGCEHDELMTRDGLNLHLIQTLKQHLLLLLALVKSNGHEPREELHPQVIAIKQDLLEAQGKLGDHSWALRTHYSWLEKSGDDVKCLFEALAQAQDVYRVVVALQQENTELKNRIAALETRADIHDDHDNRINNQLESQRALQCSLVRQFQEFSCRNEVQCTGKLLWIISDVSRKHAEARRSQEVYLESPTFYTDPNGYKVCIRLYLNGHGREWNSKMSFFFILMKGKYDAILEWPFSPLVEFRVMGQGNKRGRDVVDAFRPDPRSQSFARPVSEMNIADGAPHCAFPLEILESDGHVDDDTMFVKVVVFDK